MKKIFKILILLVMPSVVMAQINHLDSLRGLLKKSPTDSARFVSLNNIGAYYLEINSDTALLYFDKAFKIAKDNGRTLDEAIALAGKGHELMHLGKFSESFESLKLAFSLLERPIGQYSWYHLKNYNPSDMRLWVSGLNHGVLGLLMDGANEYEQAITEYKKAIKIDSQLGDLNGLGFNYLHLGTVYVSLNRMDSALLFERKAARIIEQSDNKENLGFAYREIAIVYNNKGNKILALQNFHKAIEADIKQNNYRFLAGDYSLLADYFLSNKQKDSSLFYAKKTATTYNSAHAEHKGYVYENLFKSYQLNGKTDSAYKYQSLAYKAKDSSFNATLKSLGDFQKLSFKTQLHAQQLEKEKTSIESRNRTYMLLFIIAVFMLLAGIFYHNNLQKQKANKLLSEKNREIEAQRREAQIEVALERVRARAMSMQKSDELNEVATLLFKQINNLGINTWTTGFNVWSDDNNYHVDYISSPQGGFIAPYTVDATQTEVLSEPIEAKKNGQNFFIQYIEGDRLKETYQALSKFGNKNQFDKMREGGLNFPKQLYNHFIFGSKVSLMFITYDPVPEAHDIFKRFGKVFEQTYTRFMDLEKAEEQTREAQIEAALEQVRSRSLAMKHTDELKDIVAIVHAKLENLGFNMDENAAIVICLYTEDSDEIVQWIALSSQVYPWSFRHPYFDNPILADLKNGKNMGLEYFSGVYSYEDKNAFWNYYFDYTDFSRFPDEIKKRVLEKPSYAQSIAYAKNSGILYPNIDGKVLDENQIVVLKRFANVFEQAYIRFLDLKKAEEQVIQAERDLIEITTARKNAEIALADLQLTQRQLIQKEKMASLGELTAGIAHEIQNPLNFVNNFSEVSVELLAELKEEEEKGNKEEVIAIANDLTQNLEKINHHGKRADAIVKGMLEHSRAGSGTKEPTDINKLADEYLRLSYHGLRAKDKTFNAEMVTNFDENLPLINVIPQDIGRVMLNLFNNAFYAVNQKAKTAGANYNPTVVVETFYLPHLEVGGLKVKDNGIGIPDAIKDKIMQPFFTTKPTGEGTGLGLSLTYDMVVKGHGGKIEVNSKDGEGSEFIITLMV